MCIRDRFNTSVQIERYYGYEQAMQKSNLIPQRVFIDENLPLEKQVAYEMFLSKNRPTGVDVYKRQPPRHYGKM